MPPAIAARPLAQLAHFLAELLGDLHHLLLDVAGAGSAQVVFVIGLDADGREDSDKNKLTCAP